MLLRIGGKDCRCRTAGGAKRAARNTVAISPQSRHLVIQQVAYAPIHKRREISLMADKEATGRHEEIGVLVGELRSSTIAQGAPHLLAVTGPKGIGKDRVLRAMLKQDTQIARDLLWIDLGHLASTPNLEGLLRGWLNGMSSSSSAVNRAIREFRNGWSPLLSTGSDPESLAQKISSGFAEEFVRKLARQSGMSLVIIFIVRQSDQLNSEMQRWLRQFVIEPMLAFRDAVDFRFLLSAEKLGIDSEAFRAQWQPLHEGARQIELQPFGPAQVAEWLRQKKLDETLADELCQRTGGMPEKLEAEVEGLQQERNAAQLLEIAQNYMLGKSEEEQQWLCLAGCLGTVSEDALRLFLSRDKAREAILWLQRQAIPMARNEDYLVLDDNIQRALRKYFEQGDRARFQKVDKQAAAFNAIREKIPEPDARNILAHLSAFVYFNPVVLEQVFGATGKRYAAFARSNGRYFVSGKTNYRIAEAYAKLIQQYKELTQFALPQGIEQKISSLWQTKRDTLMREMNELEARMKSEQTALAKVEDELANIDVRLRNQSRLRERAARLDEGSTPRKRKMSKPNSLGFILMIIGVVVLYLSFFFADRFTLLYACVGIGLILLGFFGPFTQSVEVVTDSQGQAQPSNPQKNRQILENADRNLRLLDIKRNSIKGKHTMAARRMSGYKNALNRLKAELDEPYA